MHIRTDTFACRLPQFFYSCCQFFFVFQITLLQIRGEYVPYGVDSFSSIFDNVSHGRTFNMDTDDIDILLNDIRVWFSGFYQHENKKSKRMADIKNSTADGWLPSINISPANMSFINEEEPLEIDCNVNTSDAATVLIKHNGEIIYEQHIL